MKKLIAAILILLTLLGIVVGFLMLQPDQTAMALYNLLGPISSSQPETSPSLETEPPADETDAAAEEETEASAPAGAGTAAPPAEIDGSKYIYWHISAERQELYEKIFRALSGFEMSLRLTEEEGRSFGSEEILDVFNFVLDDSPELFWVDAEITVSTLQSGSLAYPTEVRFSYLFSKSDTEDLQSGIDAYEAECFAGLDPDAALFDKILHVYEYIINNTEYDLSARYNQSMLSVALYGESVCKGYARMTQYLLNRLGIPCTTVNGYAGEPHSWNLVDADGDYYYLDTTWGDPQKLASDGKAEGGAFISYRYFMVTEEELAFTHEIDDVYPYPDCNSTALNYYAYTGRLFDSYDYDEIAALMREDFRVHGDFSTIRFSNGEAYRTAISMLIDESEAHGVMADVEAYIDNGYAYSYSSDDDFRILDFML